MKRSARQPRGRPVETGEVVETAIVGVHSRAGGKDGTLRAGRCRQAFMLRRAAAA